MKTSVRLLLPWVAVIGLAATRCGGSDEAAAVAAGGSAGASGGVSGGSTGVGDGGGGFGGVSAGGAGRDGGVAPQPDGGGCPASIPNDGDDCSQRGAQCGYANEICSCRGSAQTWRCVPISTDAGIPRFDGALPTVDSGFIFDDGGIVIGDGGHPAGCPPREPAGGSQCTTSGGSLLVCDYAGTACVCYRHNNQSTWACY